MPVPRWAVLLGGADGQDRGVTTLRREARNFFPG